MPTLCYPIYFRVIQRDRNTWYFSRWKSFYNPLALPMPASSELESLYGLSKREVVDALKRLGNWQTGYYLANLQDRKYYFCGETLEDVQLKLRSLGIGADDPIGLGDES
jgi:hypothetical protein